MRVIQAVQVKTCKMITYHLLKNLAMRHHYSELWRPKFENTPDHSSTRLLISANEYEKERVKIRNAAKVTQACQRTD